MRLKFFFSYAFIYLFGVTQCQDDYGRGILIDPGSGGANNPPADNVTECKTVNGESGVCVIYYLCDFIEDGHTLSAIDQCPLLYTCCQREKVASSSPSPATSKPGPEEDKNLIPTDNMSSKGSLPDLNTSSVTAGSCGYSNTGPFILTENTESNEKAAPVERVYAEIKIRAGEYVTNSEDEMYEHQERNVYKIVVHPNYLKTAMTNDIALLFLETPVTVNHETPHIGIGCLAPRLPPPGTICYGMGWGADDFANKKVYATMLKKVKLPLVGKTTCEKNLRKTSLGTVFKLHESLVCAGGEEGVDTCRGDGGAPLVCPLDKKKTRFAIYGMVAYGMGCGGKDLPGVYVNVPNLYEWVGQQLALEDLDTKSYIIG